MSISSSPGLLELLRRRWNRGGDPRSGVAWGLILLTVACALGVRISVWVFRGVAVQGEVVGTTAGADTCGLQFTFKAADSETFALESGESTNTYCDLAPGQQVPVRYLRSNPAIAKPFPSSNDWILVALSGVPGIFLILAACWNERSFLRLLKSGPGQPLSPGEVRVAAAIQPASADLEVPPAGRSVAFFYALLAAVVAAPLAVAFVTPAPLSAAEPVSSRFVAPELPEPPPGYALTLTEGKPGTSGEDSSAQLVRFEYESVQIILVPPGEIADEDRNRLEEPSGSQDSAGPTEHVSRIAYASRVDRTVSDVRPYILHGDVDISCGPITGKDASYAALMVVKGNIARASIHTAPNGVRGPPRAVRRVYVMGTVRSFQGPEQFRHSMLKNDVMDLGPDATEATIYRIRAREYQAKIERLEREFDVPAAHLEAYAGQLVTVAGGKVLNHHDLGQTKVTAGQDGVFRPLDDMKRPVSGVHAAQERERAAPEVLR